MYYMIEHKQFEVFQELCGNFFLIKSHKYDIKCFITITIQWIMCGYLDMVH